jgi:hypothetical protein
MAQITPPTPQTCHSWWYHENGVPREATTTLP